MTAFRTWLLSAPTAQMMNGGEFAPLVKELQQLWDGLRVLKGLAPYREHLVKLTKRAKRAMPRWYAGLEADLGAEIGPKPSPKRQAATQALLAEVKRISDEVLQHPPLSPVPALSRAAYKGLMRGVSLAQRRTLARHLRRLPAAAIELLAEQRGNPWLAAHLVDLFLDPSVNPRRLQPWLDDWRIRARVSLPANESETWRAWLTGQVRRPPDATACFVTFCAGRIVDAAGAQIPRAEKAGEGTEQALEPMRPAGPPADPSRIYSIREAAEAFNVPLSRLREAAKRGELKASRPTVAPNSPLQARDSDIRDYLAAQAGNRQRAPKNPILAKSANKRVQES